MCSSVTFLLTTSRMRWVPASGAKVRPVARTLRDLVEQILARGRRRAATRPTSDTLRVARARAMTFLTSGVMHE